MTRNYNFKTVTISPPWLIDALNTDSLSPGYPMRSRIASVAESYARVPLLFRGVRIRCNSLLNIPHRINRLSRNGDKTEIDWPFPVDLDWLLWRTQAAILLAGGAALVKLKNKVRVTDLQWLNPFTLTVRWEPSQVKRVYQQGGQMMVGGQSHTWTDDDMIFIREYAPLDDVGFGISSGAVALQSSRVAFSIPQMAAQFFENGAMPITTLTVAEGTETDELQRIEGFFQRAVRGVGNAFRILALRGDVKMQSTQSRMKDLETPELKDEARKDIARALELPVTLLDSDETYATATIHQRTYYSDTVFPAARMIAVGLNRDFLNPLGYELEFALEEMSIFQEDEASRAASLLQLTQAMNTAGTPERLKAAMMILGYDLSDEVEALLFAQPETVVMPNPQLPTPNEPLALPSGDADEQQLREAAQQAAQQKYIERAQFKKFFRKHGAVKASRFRFDHLDETEQAQIKQELEDEQEQQAEETLAGALITLWRQYEQDGDIEVLRAGFVNALRNAYQNTGADKADVEAAVAEQEPYLSRFLSDMDADTLSPAQVQARLALYAASVGALRERMRLQDGRDELRRWLYRPGAQHCDDCIKLHGTVRKASDWLKAGLYPRSGKTQCLGNCKCRFEMVADDMTKFASMPTINVTMPAVNINMPEQKQADVNLQPQSIQVNVPPPQVVITNEVNPTPVTVQVDAPSVSVTNDVQPTPVSVQVDAPQVNVTNEVDVPPADVKVTNELVLPPRHTETRVEKRDREGRVERFVTDEKYGE